MVSRDETTAASLIEDFNVNVDDYRDASKEELDAFGTTEAELFGLRILVRGTPGSLHLSVSNRGTGNRLFLNNGVSGSLSLGFEGNNSRVYLGRKVNLSDQHVGSRQDNDLVAIGNSVTVTGPGRWVSGLRCSPRRPAIIIGDACVLARDIVIRNSDGHPVMDKELETAQNLPATSVIIEPHCWIGERAAILKGVTVGAFAVIGFGAVVTRDVPRHYVASGNPALCRSNEGKLWCWDTSENGIARAKHFLEKYPAKDN